jgi:hypothetical protein
MKSFTNQFIRYLISGITQAGGQARRPHEAYVSRPSYIEYINIHHVTNDRHI